MPIVFVLCLVIFGSLVSAVMPVLVGTFAVFGAFAVVRLITMATDGEARSCSTRLVFDPMSGSAIPVLLLRPGRRLEHRHDGLQLPETVGDGSVSVVPATRLDDTASNLGYE